MVLSSLVVLISFFTSISTVEATEGQVITGGKISFYEDSTESTSSSTQTRSSTQTSATEVVESKPKGKLPSTGEIVKRYAIWLGSILLVIALLLFLRRRRKEEKA